MPSLGGSTATRLVFVITWMDVGGAERFALDAIAQLRLRGFAVGVVTTVPSSHRWRSEFEELADEILELDRYCVATRPAELVAFLRRFKPATIFLSNSAYMYDLLPFVRLRMPTVSIIDYGHAEQPGWRNGGYPAMSIANKASLDRTICASEHLREWMVGNGADERTCEVVRCNVDTEFWNPDLVDRDRVRSALGFSNTDVVVVMVARLDENKRPLVALEAIQAASTRAQVRAVFVGTGPLESTIAARIETLRGFTAELLSGPPSFVRDLYAAADIFILPSLAEGISLALYEAMAMGLSVVVSDVGGHSELVTPDTGRLIALSGSDADDIERFGAVLQQLVEDPDERIAIGRRARNRVLDEFSLAEMGQGLQRILSVGPIRPRPSQRLAIASWLRASGREYLRLCRAKVGATRRRIRHR